MASLHAAEDAASRPRLGGVKPVLRSGDDERSSAIPNVYVGFLRHASMLRAAALRLTQNPRVSPQSQSRHSAGLSILYAALLPSITSTKTCIPYAQTHIPKDA